MFKDREEAGIHLAEELKMYAYENPFVLAIPRGGMEIGYHIATKLECDYSVVIIKKLTYPKIPESVYGALAEDGSLYLNSRADKPITKPEIENAIKKAKNINDRRAEAYRFGRLFPDVSERSVIIADDGIASGSTMMAAVELCRKKNAGKIIVAAPVASPQLYKNLEDKVDDVVILNLSEPFYAVSQVYKKFPQCSDAEVVKYLKLWKARRNLIESLNA